MNLVDGIQLRSSAQNHMKNGNMKVHLTQLVIVLNEDALLMKKFILWQGVHLRLQKYKRDR